MVKNVFSPSKVLPFVVLCGFSIVIFAQTDQERIDFLNANKDATGAKFNDATKISLTQPELLPAKKRTRTAAEGCAEIQNGFICLDLARNSRCVDGKVSKNFVRPFSGSDLIKACFGGFCFGGTDNPKDPCTGDAKKAVEGGKNNEFFLPPPIAF